MALTNQAVCRHKLFTKLPQGDRQFSVWYHLIREQALWCSFNNYNADHGTREAILFQTSDSKLQGEILSKYLNMEAAVKGGLTMDQSKLKQDNMNSGMKMEDDVHTLSLSKKERK